MNYIIGVDIGTTNSKAVAYSFDGKVLGQANAGYMPITLHEGHHELDPLILLNSVIDIVRQTVHECSDHLLAGICFSSAMHGLIAVDHSGKPLTNMITWADLRSSSYAKKLKDTEAGIRLYHETGTPVHAMSPLCKLMWMRENASDIFLNTHKFISIKEFIFFHFFDEYVVDHSVASSTGLFDIHGLDWSREALATAGITADKLSRHVAADVIIRGLNEKTASMLNVDRDTAFIIGGSDGCMAHIGSNAFKHKDVSLTIGTSGAVRIMNDAPVMDARRRIFNYLVTDDLYLSGGPVNNGGNVLQWFAGNFLGNNFASPDEIQLFITKAMKVAPACDGLIFLPYIYGERAPVWDAEARGIFFGVSATHTLSHFMRASMEGICFSLFSILQSIEEITGPVNDIFVSGGFIRSREWVSLLSDVFGKPLHVMHAEDSSAAGAAILGLKSLGIIKDWKDAASFFTESEVYEPDLHLHEVYLRNYEVYSTLYNKFRNINN